MPELVIRIPADHFDEVAEAVASTYGDSPTMGGLKEHVIRHLRQTVIDHARQKAMLKSTLDFDITWDDLENLPAQLPSAVEEARESAEAEALRQSRPDDQT